MEEVWKDIKGYEGLYQISNLGNVKSLPKYRVKYGYGEIILKQSISRNGYKIVGLSKNNKYKTVYIHRLVAEAFIPNPKNKLEINHIDGNKQNNFVGNLEWNTRKENGKHAWKMGLFKNPSPPPITTRKVNQYTLDGTLIKTWESARDIERKMKIKSSMITNCCRGRGKTVHGFKWKYAGKKITRKIEVCN